MLTTDDVRRIWAHDRSLGRDRLNHFFFCYIHPENPNLLLLGVRLACAFDGREVRYTCPMLSRVWESDDYTQCDFRPDIRKEILTNTGIKPNENAEAYIRCPYQLFQNSTNFITMQANHERLSMEEAYWLPR